MRVLLLPPALSHRAAPHGQCPSHVAPPSATAGSREGRCQCGEGASIKKPQDLPSALRRLLNAQVADLVQVADLGAVSTSTIASAR